MKTISHEHAKQWISHTSSILRAFVHVYVHVLDLCNLYHTVKQLKHTHNDASVERLFFAITTKLNFAVTTKSSVPRSIWNKVYVCPDGYCKAGYDINWE